MRPLPTRPDLTVIFLVAALVAGGAGCSFVFVDKPPPHHRQLSSISCSEGQGLPVADTVIGGVYSAGAVAILARRPTEEQPDGTREPVSRGEQLASVAGAAGAAVLFGLSALHGFKHTESCREAKAELVARATQNPVWVPPVPYAPRPPLPAPAEPADVAGLRWSGRSSTGWPLAVRANQDGVSGVELEWQHEKCGPGRVTTLFWRGKERSVSSDGAFEAEGGGLRLSGRIRGSNASGDLELDTKECGLVRATWTASRATSSSNVPPWAVDPPAAAPGKKSPAALKPAPGRAVKRTFDGFEVAGRPMSGTFEVHEGETQQERNELSKLVHDDPYFLAFLTQLGVGLEGRPQGMPVTVRFADDTCGPGWIDEAGALRAFVYTRTRMTKQDFVCPWTRPSSADRPFDGRDKAWTPLEAGSVRARRRDVSESARKLFDHLDGASPKSAALPPAPPVLASRSPSPVPGSASLAPRPEGWPALEGRLSGGNEVRVRNPNPFAVLVGLRRGSSGNDFSVPPSGVSSVYVPDGSYEIFFNYSTQPAAVYKGDGFSLFTNGIEIRIVQIVDGNYSIKRVR